MKFITVDKLNELINSNIIKHKKKMISLNTLSTIYNR